MARNEPQVNFRIPAELKEALEKSAKESGRSITKELVLRLERTFEEDKGNTPIEVAISPEWVEDYGIEPKDFAEAIKTMAVQRAKQINNENK